MSGKGAIWNRLRGTEKEPRYRLRQSVPIKVKSKFKGWEEEGAGDSEEEVDKQIRGSV